MVDFNFVVLTYFVELHSFIPITPLGHIIVTRTDSLEANNALLFFAIVCALGLNEQHQQPESAHFQLNVAAQVHESLPVEELEDLLYLIEEGFLEEDEDLNNQIADIATEVSRDEENPAGFKCNVCGKACKSRRGLTRHSNAKHPDVSSSSGVTMSASTAAPKGSSSSSSADELSREKLHPPQLKAIVLKCAEKLSSDDVFHQVCERNFRRGSSLSQLKMLSNYGQSCEKL